MFVPTIRKALVRQRVDNITPIYVTFRRIFIQTETTPNPHAVKFLPGQVVLPDDMGTGMYIQRGDFKDIQRSPLAKKLFANDSVKGIFLGKDFITVTKNTDESWTYLKNLIYSDIFDFLASGSAVIHPRDEQALYVSDTTILDTDDEVVASIKELFESRIRPSVQEDGGDIFYVGFDSDTGIVKLSLAGSCVGCPSSAVTLRNGVEKMLMHYIPEVKGIEEVPLVNPNDEGSTLSFQPTTDGANNSQDAKNSA